MAMNNQHLQISIEDDRWLKVLPEVEKLRANVPQEWVDAVNEAIASVKK